MGRLTCSWSPLNLVHTTLKSSSEANPVQTGRTSNYIARRCDRSSWIPAAGPGEILEKACYVSRLARQKTTLAREESCLDAGKVEELISSSHLFNTENLPCADIHSTPPLPLQQAVRELGWPKDMPEPPCRQRIPRFECCIPPL